MKGEDLELKCPNCYNPIYKEQIVCVECGLQLQKRAGEKKSLISQIFTAIKWILIITVLIIICYFFYAILLANSQY